MLGREMDQIILEINKVKDKLHCIQSDYLEILAMSQKAMDDRQRTVDSSNKDSVNNKDETVKVSIPLLKHSISITESHSSKSISRLSLLRHLIVDQSNLSRLMLSAKLHDSSLLKFNVIDMIRNKVTIHSDKRNAGREMRTPDPMIVVDNHGGHDDYQVQNNHNSNEIATSNSIRNIGRFDHINNIDHDHHHGDDNDDDDDDNDAGYVSYNYSFDTNNSSNEQSDDCDSNFYPDKAFLVNYCNAVAFLLSCYYLLITLVPSLYPTTNHSSDAR